MIRSLTATTTAAFLAALLVASLATAQTSGCGKEHSVSPRTSQHNITSLDAARTFYVNLPGDYDPEKRYEVIFGFHGAGSIGPYFDADTRLSDPKWGKDKILVLPDALGKVWATGGNRTTPLDEDMQFISDLLEHMRDNYCLDNNKIFASGISNGGGIINRIACNSTLGANFAAFAPVAGAYSGFHIPGSPQCTPSRKPIPIISFHGGNDTTVPYGGRVGVLPLPPIPEWLDTWVELNDCNNFRNRTETTNGTVVWHLTWDCAGVEGAMEHFYESDMGHVWPSTIPNFSQSVDGTGPTVVNANTEIVRFFDKFPLEKTATDDPVGNATETLEPGASETAEPTETGEPSLGSVSFGLDGLVAGFVVGAAVVFGGMLV